MPRRIASFTIYHSPNAYLGSVLLRRAAAARPDVVIERRPIFVPRRRGILVTEMLGGRENRNIAAYNREDCARWAERYEIPFDYPPPGVFADRARYWPMAEFDREELPARAFYAAAETGRQDELDAALFEAAWVAGLDVNEPDTIVWAAERAGIDGADLLDRLRDESIERTARGSVGAFLRLACPGVPTFVVGGRRYYGKDRVEWAVADDGVSSPSA
jgi:2-hydroxychromene-2-carboxylate isomerase